MRGTKNMKKYKNLLFDLDGTLTDSGEGIINSVKNALNYFKIEVNNKEELKRFIGPPLGESFCNFYNLSEEESKIAIEKYREYFKEKGIFENKVYDGIDKLLEKLYGNDKKIFLATSKPEHFARQILKHFDLEKYFTYVKGATMDLSISKKPQIVELTIKECNLNLEETIMIGDRKEDIIGAKENGIDSVGALYGYGDYEELSKEGATYIIKDVKELSELLNKY